MVLEVSELHDPREPSRRPWRIRDPAYVDLVGLAASVPQKLQGLQFGTSEAVAAQPPADGRTELEQVVQQGRGARVWRNSGRDPLDVIDHGIAKAVALTYMVSPRDLVRDLRLHSPSVNFNCTSICWRPRSC